MGAWQWRDVIGAATVCSTAQSDGVADLFDCAVLHMHCPPFSSSLFFHSVWLRSNKGIPFFLFSLCLTRVLRGQWDGVGFRDLGFGVSGFLTLQGLGLRGIWEIKGLWFRNSGSGFGIGEMV